MSGTKENVLHNNAGNESSEEPQYVYKQLNDRWEICVAASDGYFQQVSFVNNIATTKGGTHVNYITEQLTAQLLQVVEKKRTGKGGMTLKPHHVKNQLFVMINCLVDNPSFDSQTKVTLTSRKGSFGSTAEVGRKFCKTLATRCGIVDNLLSWVQSKQSADAKKTDGCKKNRLTGIAKLDDANLAGTSQAHKCTLILTEGDSAKALAVSGLSVVGRDCYGVFPLKGKFLNVREASSNQLLTNPEVLALKKILGLQEGKSYTDVKSLRYGRVMIMADQDHDGSHIKGLIINFFHHLWPSLLKISGFLVEFITPIVVCRQGAQKLQFFTISEYQKWKRETFEDDSLRSVRGSGSRKWNIKYYKGLGTSTGAEAKSYFANLARHKISFCYRGLADDEAIALAFEKKQIDKRKEWVVNHRDGLFLEQNVDSISFSDFVHKELVLYSVANNQRSIPSVLDGLKPGQRKILFSCFKRKLIEEVKVVQLAGYVSEHSAYHHGEVSLTTTIIHLAQTFVGSNNINLLHPGGQFGSRFQGGKDAASARYIFTRLSSVTRLIFCPVDDPILRYLNDDGITIEPTHYLPVLPMVLVNGSSGIGTGWSSNVPKYNPLQLIAVLRKVLLEHVDNPSESEGQVEESWLKKIEKTWNECTADLHPWCFGFKGTICRAEQKENPVDDTKCSRSYQVRGEIHILDRRFVRISELPIDTWIQDYKLFLEKLVEQGEIVDFKEHHCDDNIDFVVEFEEEKLASATNAEGGLLKKLKLCSSISTANMVLFDSKGDLKRYQNVTEIMKDFFDVRLQGYKDRKQYMTAKLSSQLAKLQNRARFIQAVVKGELSVTTKKAELLKKLEQQGYQSFAASDTVPTTETLLCSPQQQPNQEKRAAAGYNYLLSQPLWSLTTEKVQALKEEVIAKAASLAKLNATSIQQLWLSDLDVLETALAARNMASSSLPLSSAKRKREESRTSTTPNKKLQQDSLRNKTEKRRADKVVSVITAGTDTALTVASDIGKSKLSSRAAFKTQARSDGDIRDIAGIGGIGSMFRMPNSSSSLFDRNRPSSSSAQVLSAGDSAMVDNHSQRHQQNYRGKACLTGACKSSSTGASTSGVGNSSNFPPPHLRRKEKQVATLADLVCFDVDSAARNIACGPSELGSSMNVSGESNSDSQWSCLSCTYINEAENRFCCVCETERRLAEHGSEAGQQWNCEACTFQNSCERSKCLICDTPKSGSRKSFK
mmetsp:Transcript_49370/g.96846  ORF Transcript_49370/g.96846 Transcript_49370/m.96846 type:complete len:1225 (+) Transcript_49370:203-3877(+)